MELIASKEILEAYGFKLNDIKIAQIGSGLINRTYLLSTESQSYILQNLNTQVFKDPSAVAQNINEVAIFLKSKDPNYLFPAPLPTINGELMTKYQDQFWRLLPFVEESQCFDTLNSPNLAFEAAKQFGRLTKLLADFDSSLLTPTIPQFHDLLLRHDQFLEALANATDELKACAKEEIDAASNYTKLIVEYENYKDRLDFPDRVIHHDTKISNVLMSSTTGKGKCVIDLDTLMPGKFISDFGDMMRTYLCEFSENESDIAKVKIRIPYFKALLAGYLSEMNEVLTPFEKQLFIFSGKYMVYMQALRFLTDYLNGNIYFSTTYINQNLDRARNQFKLLADIYENELSLQLIIEECLAAN